MWVVRVEATFKFRGVPESVIGDRQLHQPLRSLALLFVIFVRIRGESGPILVRGLRVYNSVDEFDESTHFTHLLDDYVGWLLGSYAA
jgi:hypothetical protein